MGARGRHLVPPHGPDRGGDLYPCHGRGVTRHPHASGGGIPRSVRPSQAPHQRPSRPARQRSRDADRDHLPERRHVVQQPTQTLCGQGAGACAGCGRARGREGDAGGIAGRFRSGVNNLKAIAETAGVDGVFFGPADLSVSMGYRSQPGQPAVQKVILDGITSARAASVLATDPALAQQYLDASALFLAVGVDTTLLVKAATGLVQRFGAEAAKTPAAPSGGY
ncbi:MAG: hypothetical protein JNK17_13585 [Hydrogenophaga sp.]|nr:hypothetical protein [Hydrogenophaga sp.]